jgi:hypothetical protein
MADRFSGRTWVGHPYYHFLTHSLSDRVFTLFVDEVFLVKSHWSVVYSIVAILSGTWSGRHCCGHFRADKKRARPRCMLVPAVSVTRVSHAVGLCLQRLSMFRKFCVEVFIAPVS